MIASDGDLMKDVASEAASIAGHLALSNLTVLYDDNRITIEGETGLAFSEDVGHRFEAYGWAVQRIDGHDHAAITAALAQAAGETSKPGLIVARTHIAHGSPGKHDSADSHGSPLGPEETAATKKALGWPATPPFLVPDEVRALFAARAEEGGRARQDWLKRFEAWGRAHPEKRALWDRYHARGVPEDLFKQLLPMVTAGAPAAAKPEATRVTSGRLLQKIAELVPSLCGGSADLEPSTKTFIKGSPSISRASFEGRNFHFGIREHGMGAVLNGLALHGGPIPYGATFLIFADYMRPPIRLAAMAGLQVIYVFTHDSVFLGEDGPTHQPIEQVPGLRLVPNLAVVRPADGPEVAMAWTLALRRRGGPTALVLTRQDVPLLKRAAGFDPEVLFRGGYILSEAGAGTDRVVLIATGSEVAPAQQAQEILAAAGIGSRLVSMPSPDEFLSQPEDYRRGVVPPGARTVVIEAARLTGWERVAGREALLIGLDRFGASAFWKVIAEKLGFTGQAIAERVRLWLARPNTRAGS